MMIIKIHGKNEVVILTFLNLLEYRDFYKKNYYNCFTHRLVQIFYCYSCPYFENDMCILMDIDLYSMCKVLYIERIINGDENE